MDDEELGRYRLVPGDLLFNRTNSKELVGKCEMFGERGDWVFASYLIRVRLQTANALPQFVSDFLSTNAGRLQIDRLSRQIIGMTNINAEELRTILLPLPPLSKQRELVVAMDAARAARRAKRAEAEALLAGMDVFIVKALDLILPAKDERMVFAVPSGGVSERLDPHFYLPSLAHNMQMLQQAKAEPLGTLVSFSGETWDPAAHDEPTFRYIEISNVNPQTGEAQAEETSVSEAPSRARMAVRTNDIIVSLTRPHHGSIARITPNLDGCVASTGFSVLRGIKESRVSRDYLWSILRANFCLRQMLQRASGGNYPAITEAELAKVLVPVPKPSIQARIADEAMNRLETAQKLRQEAEQSWQRAKAEFEAALLGKG